MCYGRAIPGLREESVDPTRRHVLRLTTGAAALARYRPSLGPRRIPNRPVKWVVGFAPPAQRHHRPT